MKNTSLFPNALQSPPVIVVGGGPVGQVLALFLAQRGLAVTVLETRAEGASFADDRALALSDGSRQILAKLDVWNDLAQKATQIESIHVSQKGSIGRTVLRAQDYQQDALGYVLSYGALSQVLGLALKLQPNVTCHFAATATAIHYDTEKASVTFTQDNQSKTLSSALLVLADGGRSVEDLAGLTRDVKDYGHHALISKVKAELPHGNMAFERFVSSGPLALLPNGQDGFSLVWTGKTADIERLLALNDADFLDAFHQVFGDRVGQFLSVEKRMAFPLKMATLHKKETPHMVVIGNAAQTMHPVAGQGFNVGLRDAESLASHIAQVDATALGSVQMIHAYQKSREKDTRGGLKFTDFLVNIFSNDILGVSSMRGASLGLLDVLPFAKAYLVRKMSVGK